MPQKNNDGSTLTDWTFDVDALDQNADSVRYRMAHNSELGGGTSVNATGLSFDNTSGKITWSGSGTRTVGLYSGGIVAEDFDSNGDILSKSHVDFLLDLRDASQFELTPPTQVSDSRNEIVEKGIQSTFSFDGTGFDVVALGDAQGALVETSPNNFTFNSGATGSPLDPGVYPITFEIIDSIDAYTNNYYSVNFIIPDPEAPIISNLQDDRTPYFTPGTAVTIDSNQNASITDSTNVDFNGGKLKLNLSNSDYTNEILAINSVGTGVGEISVSGSSISYQGSVIGTIDADLDGSNNILAIDFTSTDATLEAVAALIQQLNYTNSVEAADRDLTLFLQDSDGHSNFYSLYLQAVNLDNSQTSAAPETLTADGSSEATITIALFDSSSRAFTSSGGAVEILSDMGTVSTVTDNADGTYTAVLSSTTSEVATVSATVNAAALSNSTSVDFQVGPASGSITSLSVSDSTPATDDTVTIIVQSLDAQGNVRTSGGDSVSISTTQGSISSTVDSSDGTYTATLTNTSTGSATVSATINTASATDTELVTFSAGAADTAPSSMEVSNANPTTDDTVTVTIQAVDSNGNNLTSGGDTVVFTTSAGSISATTDVGNGTYTAELTNSATGESTDTVVFSTTLGTVTIATDNSDGSYTAQLTNPSTGEATVSATLNGTSITDTETVTFSPGAATAANTTLSVSNPTPTTDDSVIVTVQAVDAQGNNHTSGGDLVVISSDKGVISATTDNEDGTYSATLTRVDTGAVAVTATINEAAVTNSASVRFSSGAADATTSVLSVANNEVTTVESTVVTLQTKDQHGNDLREGGLQVSFITTLGTLTSPVVDNADGSYSVSFNSSTSGTASISVQVEGATVDSTVSVQVSASVADPIQSRVTSSPDSLVANGTSIITVQMVDASGNLLNSGEDRVTLDTDRGLLSDIVNNGDGTYTAVYTTPEKLGQLDAVVTLTSTINGEPGSSASIALTLNPAGDEDDDGTADYLDTDSDNDGIPDILETDRNSDGDDAPDYLDTDSDNDGIPDSIENPLPALSGTDSDADGIDDVLDVDVTEGVDANQNGIDDRYDVSDLDGDSVPDYLDSDSDNDGIPDSLEGSEDTDGDGIADYRDEDSNNDGISDRVAANISGIDTDMDGISDEFDVDNTGGADENGDGVDDAATLGDFDGDGIPDVQDADIDGDGVTNTEDRFPQDSREARDADSDGLGDNEDDDDDNDGYTDKVEAANGTSSTDSESLPSAVDTDGDLIADSVERGNDTDNDGIEDYLEVDSDNDGIFDHIEASEDTVQARLNDTDSDGRVDAGSRAELLFIVQDTDGDGVDDYRDLDSDNDNISDLIEGGGSDADDDGRQDDFVDANGDGFSDTLTAGQLALNDTDLDGLPDFIDLDSDQDGLVDLLETAGTDDNRDGRVDEFIDLNGDGWTDVLADSRAFLIDTDNDGMPNFRDLDSDNDGIFDLVESGRTDEDNDGVVDVLDSDEDGIPDAVDIDVTGGVDADNDGIDDQFDPSFSDLQDTDNDGIIDQFDTDANGDGLDDRNTSGEPGLGAALPDSDNDGIADVLDESEDSVHTGLSGSGCSIASSSGADPFFWIMVVLAGIYFYVAKRCRKAKRTLRSMLLVLVGVLLSGSIQADERRGLYLGAGVAITTLKPEVEGTSFTVDDTSSAGWHALVGYRFHRRWQAEIDYADLGDASLSPSATVAYSELNASVLYDIWKGSVFGDRRTWLCSDASEPADSLVKVT